MQKINKTLIDGYDDLNVSLNERELSIVELEDTETEYLKIKVDAEYTSVRIELKNAKNVKWLLPDGTKQFGNQILEIPSGTIYSAYIVVTCSNWRSVDLICSKSNNIRIPTSTMPKNMNSITGAKIVGNARELPVSLKHLDISLCKTSFSGVIDECPKTLEEFVYDPYNGLPTTVTGNLKNMPPNMKKFHIEDCYYVEGCDVNQLPSSLEYFKLYNNDGIYLNIIPGTILNIKEFILTNKLQGNVDNLTFGEKCEKITLYAIENTLPGSVHFSENNHIKHLYLEFKVLDSDSLDQLIIEFERTTVYKNQSNLGNDFDIRIHSDTDASRTSASNEAYNRLNDNGWSINV